MSVQDELLKSIQVMIDTAIDQRKFVEVASVVEEIRGNKYVVTIDGGKYEVKDGINLKPEAGTPVWIKLPNGRGNMTGAYIMARR